MDKQATLVTGASRGIGRALADLLARQGHHVVGMARSKPKGGFDGDFYTADFQDESASAAALAEIAGRYRITRLVNNAGISHAQKLDDMTDADFERVMAINVRSALQCMQAVLPAMRAAKFGRIVNVTSRAGLGRPERALYGMSKAGLVSLSRTVALEVVADGITVNCVAPGPIETEMFLGNHPPGSEKYRNFIATVPMQRMGHVDEIAEACAYFLSDKAGYTTGQVLYVCGGLSVGNLMA
ncbi:MAG: SDR family oxidoreductase [Hyphomicrobiaceae bacterium]